MDRKRPPSPLEMPSQRAFSSRSVRPSERKLDAPPAFAQFQKEFTNFDSITTKLRHLDYPPDLISIFTSLDEVKALLPGFLSSCSKISKKRALNSRSNITKAAENSCQAFISSFHSLIRSFESVDTHIFSSFLLCLQQRIGEMTKCISDFGNVCSISRPAMTIFKRMQPTIQASIQLLDSQITDLFSASSLKSDSSSIISSAVSESKGLSRAFESEITGALRSSKPIASEAERIFGDFRSALSSFVSQLSEFPDFVHQFDSVVSYLPELSQLFSRALSELGLVDPQSTSHTVLIGREAKVKVEAEVESIDPLFEFFTSLSSLANGLPTPKEIDQEYMANVLSLVSDRILSLEQENHTLKTRIDALHVLEDGDSIKSRLDENESYRKKLAQQSESSVASFCDTVLGSIKCLAKADVTHPNDSLQVQVQCVVSSIKDEIDSYKSQISSLKSEIKQARDILGDFDKTYLAGTASLGPDLQSSLKSTISSIYKVASAPNSSTEQMSRLLKMFNRDASKSPDSALYALLSELIQSEMMENRQLKEYKSKSEEKIQSTLSNISMRLAAIAQSRSTDPSNIPSLLDSIEKSFEASQSLRAFLGSFLSQMQFVMGAEPVRMRGLSDDDLKSVMTNLLGESQVTRPNQVSKSPEKPIKIHKEIRKSYSGKADQETLIRLKSLIVDDCRLLSDSDSLESLPIDRLCATLHKLIESSIKYAEDSKEVLKDLFRMASVEPPEQLGDLEEISRDLHKAFLNAITLNVTPSRQAIVELWRLSCSVSPAASDSHDTDGELLFIGQSLRLMDSTLAAMRPILQLLERLVFQLSSDPSALNPDGPLFSSISETMNDICGEIGKLECSIVHPFYLSFVKALWKVLNMLFSAVPSAKAEVSAPKPDARSSETNSLVQNALAAAQIERDNAIGSIKRIHEKEISEITSFYAKGPAK